MLVLSQEQWDESMSHIGQHDTLVMDTETDGIVWWRNRVVSVQIGAGDREFYFPFRHAEGPNLDVRKLRHLAENVLRPDRLQIGFNYSFDILIMLKEGMRRPERIRDPMLAAHLMNENEDSFKMEGLAARYLDPAYADAEEALIDKIVERFGGGRKYAKSSLWRLPAAEVASYGLQDIRTTRELDRFYQEPLKTWKLDELIEEVYDFQLMLVDVQARGVPISKERLQALGEEAGPLADEYERRIQEMSREDLEDPDFPGNPRSHKQMQLWLGKTVGVPNTQKEVLKLYDDERCQLLLDYRVWGKLKSSFVDPYWEKIAPDGRIHPGLYITSPGTRVDKDMRGTGTGRLSSANPNMQQVPEQARHMFNAPPGYRWVKLDYSQAELRLAAHYHATRFGDLSMGRVLMAGEDMHATVAANANVPRKEAKRRNFAIAYGAGPKKLALMANSSIQKEREYYRTYFRTYPGERELANQTEYEARTRGYIRFWTGRTRRFNTPRVGSYKAKNSLIQGGVAEMIRRASVRIWREVADAEIVLLVHDDVNMLVPTEAVTDVVAQARYIMQDQPWCTLPMVVDAEHGPSWGELTELPRDPAGIPAEVMQYVTDPTLVKP